MRNIHWMAVLRSCCSIEAYPPQARRRHGPAARRVVPDPASASFPRSIRFCVDAGPRRRSPPSARRCNPLAIDAAERILGRLDAQLEYGELAEILAEGVPAYLQKIQTGIAEAAMAVQKAYFLH